MCLALLYLCIIWHYTHMNNGFVCVYFEFTLLLCTLWTQNGFKSAHHEHKNFLNASTNLLACDWLLYVYIDGTHICRRFWENYNVLWAHVTDANFARFSGYWQYLVNCLSVGLCDCERVYQRWGQELELGSGLTNRGRSVLMCDPADWALNWADRFINELIPDQAKNYKQMLPSDRGMMIKGPRGRQTGGFFNFNKIKPRVRTLFVQSDTNVWFICQIGMLHIEHTNETESCNRNAVFYRAIRVCILSHHSGMIFSKATQATAFRTAFLKHNLFAHSTTNTHTNSVIVSIHLVSLAKEK